MFTKTAVFAAVMASAVAGSQQFARAEATSACDASLSSIVTDMPTMPAAVVSRTITDSCTVDVPLTLSDDFMSAFTSWVYWGADVSPELNEWASKCDPDSEKIRDLVEPFNIGGADCSDVWLVFRGDKETKSTLAASAFADENFTFSEDQTASDGGGITSAPSAGASETPSATATSTSDAEGSDATDSQSSGTAAASTGTDGGDDDSGAVAFGSKMVIAAAVAATAGFVVGL